MQLLPIQHFKQLLVALFTVVAVNLSIIFTLERSTIDLIQEFARHLEMKLCPAQRALVVIDLP